MGVQLPITVTGTETGKQKGSHWLGLLMCQYQACEGTLNDGRGGPSCSLV